ncbi:MAG TPA: ester cyclase [Thermomicrobiales bacterium]|nr:ester cyclase [Thermomicrobiales bacterium]
MVTRGRAGQGRVEREGDPTGADAEPGRATEAGNVAVIRRTYEAINHRDLAAATQEMAPTMMDEWQGNMRFLQSIFDAFPDGHWELEDLLADGDKVAARDTLRGTHAGPFMGVAPTGKAVTMGELHLWRLAGGKIAAHWVESDLPGLLRQLGAAPAPEGRADGEADAAEAEADLIRATERERLRALVEVDLEAARRLHADDFQLINPAGATLTKEQYLGGVASGEIDYRVLEPDSALDVRLYGAVALVRYRSRLEIVVVGRLVPLRRYWHTDSYEKRDGRWQSVWSQCTAIQ